MGMFDNIFNKRTVIKADNSGNVFNYKFEQGIDCDTIPNAYGEFGRTPTNPIPVNGSKGEVLYLSRLRTLNNRPFFFID